jgi:hypothetical protein
MPDTDSRAYDETSSEEIISGEETSGEATAEETLSEETTSIETAYNESNAYYSPDIPGIDLREGNSLRCLDDSPLFSWNPTTCGKGHHVVTEKNDGYTCANSPTVSDQCPAGAGASGMQFKGFGFTRGFYPIHAKQCEGINVPLYCMDHHAKSPNATSPSLSFDEAAPGVGPESKCAIAWVLANGYNTYTHTRLGEWFSGLGASGDCLDAFVITQAVVWTLLGQVPSDARFSKCGGGAAPVLNKAYLTLLRMATEYGNTHDCKSGSGDTPACQCDCTSDVHSGDIDEMTPSNSGETPKFRNPNEPVLSNCDADAQSIKVCASNTRDLTWEVVPSELRIVCSHIIVGPIRVKDTANPHYNESTSPGDEPVFRIEATCGCSEGFSHKFTDYCGSELEDGPKVNEDFYVMMPITNMQMCFTICTRIILREFAVFFIGAIPGEQVSGLAARPCCVPEVACICICVEIPLEPPPPPPPPPPIVYFPPPPVQPPPRQLPPIYNPPPVLVAPPQPQPPDYVPPPPPIVVDLPPPPELPPIINPPSVLVPPPPPPPPPLPPIQPPPPVIQPPPLPPPPPPPPQPQPIVVLPQPPRRPPPPPLQPPPIIVQPPPPPPQLPPPPPVPPPRLPRPPVRVVIGPQIPPPPPVPPRRGLYGAPQPARPPAIPPRVPYPWTPGMQPPGRPPAVPGYPPRPAYPPPPGTIIPPHDRC